MAIAQQTEKSTTWKYLYLPKDRGLRRRFGILPDLQTYQLLDRFGSNTARLSKLRSVKHL
jgi:hypothetical protein